MDFNGVERSFEKFCCFGPHFWRDSPVDKKYMRTVLMHSPVCFPMAKPISRVVSTVY
jgi:hypothetical protein